MSFWLTRDPSALRRRDRWLAWICAVLLGVLVARAALRDGGVLVRNQEFGARFLAGEDPYFDPGRGHRIHGPYPPSFALIAAPLSRLSTPAARIAWALAQAGALVLLYVLARRWLGEHWPALAPHAPLVYAAALLLASRYVLRDMAGGGGNLLFAALALFGIDRALRGRALSGGASLAFSLVLKPNLALFVLALALRRRWKACAATALCALALYCAPAVIHGAGPYFDLTRRWLADVVDYARASDLRDPRQVPVGMPLASTSMNQSLRDAVDRLARPSFGSEAVDVHLFELSPETAAAIARTLGLALAVLTCWVTVRAPPGRGELVAVLAFLPLGLLLSPISWKAHHAVLLPLFCVLVASAVEALPRKRLLWLLALYFVACDLASEEIVGDGGKELLQSLSIVTWGDVALLLAALAVARRSAAPT